MKLQTIFIFFCLLLALTNAKDYDWTSVEDTIEFYRTNGAFSGGVLRVSNGTHAIYNYPFGHYTKN
jgi:hypothetical protein